MAGLVAGAASAATMTQLINGPSDIRVVPLVEASWAQGDVNGSSCYNSKTPHNYVCGCVATAAGEIMRRWQYPAAASVRRTNTCSTNGVQASFTMIGGPNVAYDWANMPFKPEGEASLSTAQREAIGTLLYDIGVAAGMDWTSNGSSTSTSIMVDQFTSVFGYSNAAIAGNPSGTGLSLEQFTQAVLPSLDAGMPVIVGIGGSNTQHSVVCDGYGYQDGDLYIHINMGSAIDSESPVGYNNTWYKFPTAVMNISTKEYTSGNGVSLWPNGEQSYLNPVVYNISPTMQKGWSIVSGRILSGETVVEGAEIVAVNASGEGVAKATSNAKGIYAIALPAGTYTLRAVDSDETKGARVSVTVVATAGTRDGATATGVVIGNQHGVDIALADIGRDFFASETPDEYLDYVESTGSQYVDTGVAAGGGTKAVFKMRWTAEPAADWMFLGARARSNNNRLYYLYTYNGYFWYGFGTKRGSVSPSFTPAVNSDYTFSVELTNDKHWKASVAGNNYDYDCSDSSEVVNPGVNIFLFASNDNGSSVSMHSKARCYALKIWKDGVLERDFVPCRKNGEAGLYDKVSKSIFVSKGSKPLIAGPVSSVVEEPDEFLDYVESNGNQYIDTGVVGKFGTRAEMKFNANSDNGSGVHLLGACVAGSTYFHFCYFGSKLNAGFGSETWNYAWSYNKGITYELESGCSLDKKVWLNLGTDLSGTQTVSGATDSGLNLYAFARNNGGSADGKCSVKLYTMKIWQTDANGNEILLRDFVPCRKDGEPGLYDKVTKSIFYSRGTQPFIAGSLPGYPDEILDYVEATGSQYVDTGVVGKSGTKVNLNIEPTATSESYFLASRSGSERFLFFYLFSNKINVGYRDKYNAKNFGTCSTGKRYNLTADISQDGSAINATCTADGTALSATSSSWTSGRIDTGLNMYMFSINWDGAAKNYFKGKCYGVKIWQIPDGGTEYVLVSDFVPCKKDGVAGLWDRVTKKIFYSKTSTALVAGNTIAKVGTPDSFVEYVESSGTQYIDTGVLGKAGTKSEAKMMWLESGNDWVFLGARVDSGDTRFNLVQTYNGGFGYGYGIFRYWSGAKADAETLYTVETEYTSTSKKLVVNDNTWMNESATAFNADIPLYMFAMNYNGTASNIAKARCYSVTIDQVDGDGDYQPKRNFAPCVKGGKAALYDSVTGMIYYPQGGDLTASANEASVTSAQWIGGTVTSAADLANAANWKCWQAGLVVYGKAPVTVSEGVATLTCPVTLDVAADWSAAGVITLASGATVDLNGHVLATAGFALAEGQTVSVLKNLPKGWKVKKSTDGRTLTIVKIKGVMVIVE